MSTAIFETQPLPVAFNHDGSGGRACSAATTTAAVPGIEAWLSSAAAAPPYVHPLLRRSSSFLSQKSLEICTESLGSESGSDDISEFLPWETHKEKYPINLSDEEQQHLDDDHDHDDDHDDDDDDDDDGMRKKEITEVNYHCSKGLKSTVRSFPPPLPSLSRRDGPCLSMRTHRQGGRLVMEAVSVPSQNYLHVQRSHGRLLLSFVETSFREIYPDTEEPPMEMKVEDEEEVEEEEEAEAEEEEEEVEVVDRGTLVEVKVSSSPQSGFLKVQRSSVVINKFVGVAAEAAAEKNSTATTTTATAVVVAAAAASSYWRAGGGPDSAKRLPSPEKLMFTSKRVMNREELMHRMRGCSELRRPLFIWDPCCAVRS